MKIVLVWLMMLSFTYGFDATIDVVKKVQTMPTIAVEDSSKSYDDTYRLKFYKALIADLNVISLFNVDRYHRLTEYENGEVVLENRDKQYVLRYEIQESDSKAFTLKYKLIKDNSIIFSKNYKISNPKHSLFIAHAIAYDINEFMGADSITWIKKKVIFSRVVSPRKSELVISDYTLSYQHTVVSGGFNVFPKWANSSQNSFYYTSLDTPSPTLFHVDMTTGAKTTIMSSDGMMICSDVNSDGSKLLLTMAPDGQPDIYMYDTKNRTKLRVTSYSGIDVSGQFKDNNNVVFVSNRLGYPNI